MCQRFVGKEMQEGVSTRDLVGLLRIWRARFDSNTHATRFRWETHLFDGQPAVLGWPRMNKLKFPVGSAVAWKWLGGRVKGVVEEAHFARVEREIKGKHIVRNGSPTCPAYLVRSVAGNLALKLETELCDGNR
jgi:hypothetical protein